MWEAQLFVVGPVKTIRTSSVPHQEPTSQVSGWLQAYKNGFVDWFHIEGVGRWTLEKEKRMLGEEQSVGRNMRIMGE